MDSRCLEGHVVVKGVHTADDARRAIDAGADAIVVSNHGGRQLDGVAATIRVLPAVVAAVDGRIEVLLDGGIRRGSDVVKALCLGARAVLIGRAYAYGLGARRRRRHESDRHSPHRRRADAETARRRFNRGTRSIAGRGAGTRFPMMKTSHTVVLSIVAASLVGAPPVRAQLAAPGPSGVVMGHLHLTARDGAASRTFWTALGGLPVQNGALQLLQFPGTFVMLRQGQPTAGTEGSTVDHVTFRVRDLKQAAERWSKEAGIAVGGDGMITTSDGIRVRMVSDPSIDGAIRMDSISIATVAPSETHAWYVKQFGATAAKSASPLTAVLPGVTLEFAKADAAPAGTRGRALDHIGFEVKNLEEFCKNLEAAGVKLDRPYARLPNSTTAIAFLTDPWGTYIELTENLAPPK